MVDGDGLSGGVVGGGGVAGLPGDTAAVPNTESGGCTCSVGNAVPGTGHEGCACSIGEVVPGTANEGCICSVCEVAVGGNGSFLFINECKGAVLLYLFLFWLL